MTGDRCGNVYIVETDGQIRRMRPDGTVEPYLKLTSPDGVYCTAVSFGSGIGGWERDHLYIMNRSGGMFVLDAGIEGRPEPHLP
jgi:hypothetical protein